MKINNNSKYVLYIILFIIFVLIRINHVLSSGEIENISLKGLGIASASWPFGIIKECALNDNFTPFYYLIIGIIKNEFFIKIFNFIVAFINICLFIDIGKKISNEKLGIFLGVFLAINHFFLYYTSLFAPYCLIFLIHTLLISSLIDYFKKPNKKNFKKLNIFNCLLILCDSLGFLYVVCEFFVLYIIGKKKKRYLAHCIKLFNFSFVAFLILFPVLVVQYVVNSKLVIPNTFDGIGLNLSSLYLMLSEYVSPYLSFIAPETQTKSTIGLLYSYFLNPDIRNINSFKILITLFYSTILPLLIIAFLTIKTCLKNVKLRLIWLISLFNLVLILFLMLIEKLEVQPIYSIQFFITSLVILGYGISVIKDIYVKIILITCLITIQVINPELNSFDITLTKNYTVLNPVKNFIEEYQITSEDVIIMPNGGKFASKILKKQNFLNYDDTYLKTSKKKGIIRNIASKKAKTINKKNIQYLTREYLLEKRTNPYLMTYFTQNVYDKNLSIQRLVLIVDKLNSKPISANSIVKCANQKDYSPKMRKIDFRYADLSQNDSQILYNALKSKTLYNLLNILNVGYSLDSIIEYKKVDNEYYKVPTSNNIYKAISSFDSDYVFLIFR